MLLLKRHLIELVRTGKKTQTIRLWKRPMVRAGQAAFVPGLGRVLIECVEEIAGISKLTREDAVADGFVSLAALRRELRAIYGGMRDAGKKLYRVRFHWPAPSQNGSVTKDQMRAALAAHLRKRAG